MIGNSFFSALCDTFSNFCARFVLAGALSRLTASPLPAQSPTALHRLPTHCPAAVIEKTKSRLAGIVRDYVRHARDAFADAQIGVWTAHVGSDPARMHHKQCARIGGTTRSEASHQGGLIFFFFVRKIPYPPPLFFRLPPAFIVGHAAKSGRHYRNCARGKD